MYGLFLGSHSFFFLKRQMPSAFVLHTLSIETFASSILSGGHAPYSGFSSVLLRPVHASATNEKAAALCSLAPTRSDCCQLPRKKPTYVAKRKPNQSLAGCCYSHTSLHALAFQRLQVDNDLASTCAAFSGISSWFCNRTRSKCLVKAATGPFRSRGAGTGNQNQGQQVVRFVCSLF